MRKALLVNLVFLLNCGANVCVNLKGFEDEDGEAADLVQFRHEDVE